MRTASDCTASTKIYCLWTIILNKLWIREIWLQNKGKCGGRQANHPPPSPSPYLTHQPSVVAVPATTVCGLRWTFFPQIACTMHSDEVATVPPLRNHPPQEGSNLHPVTKPVSHFRSNLSQVVPHNLITFHTAVPKRKETHPNPRVPQGVNGASVKIH